MRATWLTSLVTGVGFGILAVLGDRVGEQVHLILLAIFFVSTLFGVIGLPQLREAFAECRARGALTLMRREDLHRFYLPVWGRMFMWFLSTAATGLIAKSMGI
jgi:hypothetical protein